MEGECKVKKGLVIGADSGIGLKIGWKLVTMKYQQWLTPGKGTLNVIDAHQASEYVRMHGPFNQIVYSAGVNKLAWVSDLGRNRTGILAEIFSVNVLGFIDLMSAHERWWPEATGSAVVITSDAAERPMRGSTAYCASKAALNMAVRCMARELAPRWRINAIAPGMTSDTEMTRQLDRDIPAFRGWTPEFALEYERSQIPMGRRALPEEVADLAISTLNGPEYLTGSIIAINGGR
jgi:NAD(P)-dependent dehydrogenase (short-subunit alcohol dehydrogenase family)